MFALRPDSSFSSVMGWLPSRVDVKVPSPKTGSAYLRAPQHSQVHTCSSPSLWAPLLPTLAIPFSTHPAPACLHHLCILSQRGSRKSQGHELAEKLPCWSHGSVSVPKEREGFQRNAFFFSFFELGNELIIVYRGSMILDPGNGAKT